MTRPLDPDTRSSEEARVGLCLHCHEARQLVNPRGNAFYQCRRGQNDPRFRDYPGLPVRECSGFVRREPTSGPPGAN